MHHLFSDPSLSLIKVDQHTTFSIVSHLLIVLNKRDLRPDPAQGDPAGPITLPPPSWPDFSPVHSVSRCRHSICKPFIRATFQWSDYPAISNMPTHIWTRDSFYEDKFYWTSVNITDSRGQSLVSNVIM